MGHPAIHIPAGLCAVVVEPAQSLLPKLPRWPGCRWRWRLEPIPRCAACWTLRTSSGASAASSRRCAGARSPSSAVGRSSRWAHSCLHLADRDPAVE